MADKNLVIALTAEDEIITIVVVDGDRVVAFRSMNAVADSAGRRRRKLDDVATLEAEYQVSASRILKDVRRRIADSAVVVVADEHLRAVDEVEIVGLQRLEHVVQRDRGGAVRDRRDAAILEDRQRRCRLAGEDDRVGAVIVEGGLLVGRHGVENKICHCGINLRGGSGLR